MEKLYNIQDSVSFTNKIAEITSINVDHEENIFEGKIDGNFLINGTYKSHGISFNQENFSFKIPFECPVYDMNNDTINVEIDDFVYDIDNNDLNVNIDYYVKGEKIIIEPTEERVEEVHQEAIEEEKIDLINNDINLPNTYVTYIIYTVKKSDTLISIANEYKVSIDLIKEYNEITEITEGIKLVIPQYE